MRARRAAAYRAYWEHMPLARARKPEGPDLQLYRRFTWGKLVDVQRARRAAVPLRPAGSCLQRDASGYCAEDLDPARTMLGAEQRDWLLEELASTKARWNILAQQTAFAPFEQRGRRRAASLRRRADNWDGYVAERQRILDWVVEHETPRTSWC